MIQEISNCILTILKKRLSKQLNIDESIVEKILNDETFMYPVISTSSSHLLSSSIVSSTKKDEKKVLLNNLQNKEPKIEEVKEDFIFDNTVNDTNINNIQIKKEDTFDNELYTFDFRNLTYNGSEEFWKHKGIKIDGEKYRLHLATNLVLKIEDDKLCLYGIKVNEYEIIEKEDLPNIILEWCKVHSIHV